MTLLDIAKRNLAINPIKTLNSSKDQLSNDASFRKLVNEQATAWSELVAKHRVEEWTSARSRLNEQRDLLKKMMEQTQLAQMKQLEAKHERYWQFRAISKVPSVSVKDILENEY